MSATTLVHVRGDEKNRQVFSVKVSVKQYEKIRVGHTDISGF